MDLSSLPDDGLSRLVANCVHEAVGHGPRRGLALAKLHNAYPEIERRSAKLDDKGLLALMGYRVGYREGMAEERRRAVLAFVEGVPPHRVVVMRDPESDLPLLVGTTREAGLAFAGGRRAPEYDLLRTELGIAVLARS